MWMIAKRKNFVRKWVSGMQEMMMQIQSEHKMSP